MRIMCVCVLTCVCEVAECTTCTFNCESPCSTHCLPIVFHCHCMQSPDVECVHLTQPFHMCSPLDISHTGASTVDSGRDPVLSQKVYGELG